VNLSVDSAFQQAEQTFLNDHGGLTDPDGPYSLCPAGYDPETLAPGDDAILDPWLARVFEWLETNDGRALAKDRPAVIVLTMDEREMIRPAHAVYFPPNNTMYLARDRADFNKYFVLHEMGHWLAGGLHGPVWAAAQVKLVREFLGPEYADDLAMAYANA
jgi:hypothetical protein